MAKYYLPNKALLLCFIGLLINSISYGQKNLVPNYSFEDYISCPVAFNKDAPPPPPWYYTCKYYINTGYLNACANGSISNYGVPYNFIKGSWNYQPAHTGQAYIIVDYLFYEQPILQASLSDSLRKNKKYYCEFFVNQINAMTGSCNNHGMLLTKTAIYPDTVNYTCGVLYANPQILPYGNPIITDTVNWVKVAGIYTAQGGEKYVSIGNFYDWHNTQFITTNPTGTGNGASYLIDDVSIIPLDSICLKADAGRDTAINAGDSVFIGSYTNGLDSLLWLQNGTIPKDSTRPGFYVSPNTTTFYVLHQIVNGCFSSDTVTVNVIIVPLTITSFSAFATPLSNGEGQGVRLKWQTMNEVNVSHYNVQRSINGKDFITVCKVKANNKVLNEYRYTDDRLPLTVDGQLYYRIVGVDNDGKMTYSEVRTVDRRPLTVDGISIFPNPCRNYVNITGNNIQQIIISSIEGKVLYKSSSIGGLGEAKQIDISNYLSNGIYLINIKTDNDYVTQKLIKL